jgi:hypothetical protein
VTLTAALPLTPSPAFLRCPTMGTRQGIALDFDELELEIEECRLAGAGRVWLRALTLAAGRYHRPPFSPLRLELPEDLGSPSLAIRGS